MTKITKRTRGFGFKLLFLIPTITLSSLIIIGSLYFVILNKNLPSPNEFNVRRVNQSTKIYDRTGQILLYEVYGEEKRTIVPFEEIPDFLKRATIATEDTNFYTRPPFDWQAIIRAFLTNLKEKRIVQGGSTITQQLARNVFLSSKKTIDRKVKELILAFKLESKYTKDEILSLYLNQIPYGSNNYGVEAASQSYFNKSVKDVSLAEAAILAALPKAPTYYSPWGENKQQLFERQHYILDRMVELGHINKEEGDKAKNVKIVFAPATIGNIKAPHFSLMVKDYLINRYGENTVNAGGLKVITTLDWPLQKLAEKVIKEGSSKNEELYGSKNAAMVVQDPKAGQILALVGSRDYFDVANNGNFNVARQGLRQPGSALKPFIYLTAFEKGYSPKTIIYDVSTEFDLRNDLTKSYKPENFDGKIHGPISFEQALGQSINIPAVKVLYLAGFDDVLKNLNKFGISTLKERWRYGLSLALGGGAVKLMELVNAYAVLAQEGIFHKQNFVLKIEDGKGNILEEYNDQKEMIVDSQYPRLVNQILSSAELRSPIFRAALPLTIFDNYEVALKTGTSEDHRDAWTVGYTPFLAVGVWAGNNDNTPMIRQGSSILAAVPIWNLFLKEALKYYQPEAFNKPDPLPLVNKPMLNGQAEFNPMINNKKYPQIHSILYYIDKKNPLGPAPENPNSDPQFQNWENSVLAWARNNIFNFYEYNQPLPDKIDSIIQASQEQITTEELIITSFKPNNGDFINSPFVVQADLNSKNDLKRVELYFNWRLINAFNISGNFYRYQYYFNLPLEPQNLIKLKAFDNLDKENSISVIVFKKTN